jgi:hypothetical protein
MSTATATMITIDKVLAHQGIDTSEKRMKLYENVARMLMPSSKAPYVEGTLNVVILEGVSASKSKLAHAFEKSLEDVGVVVQDFNSNTDVKDVKVGKDATSCLVNIDAHPEMKMKMFDGPRDQLPSSVKSILCATLDSRKLNLPESKVDYLYFECWSKVTDEERCAISDEPTDEMLTVFRRVFAIVNTGTSTIDKVLAHQGIDTAEKRVALYQRAAQVLMPSRADSSKSGDDVCEYRSPLGVLILEGLAGTGKSKLLHTFEKALTAVGVGHENIEAGIELKEIASVGTELCLVHTDARSETKLFDVPRDDLPTSVRSIMYATNDNSRVNMPKGVTDVLHLKFDNKVEERCVISDEPTEEMFAVFRKVRSLHL